MLNLYAFLLGIRLLHAHTYDCPGWCGHPLEKLVIWTDNPNIWRCELPSITVTRCSDVAIVECLRLDDLGGDLYLMLFADSPNVIGIDPEYLAKGRSDVLKTKIHCKNGIWTLPDSHIRMTHLLCDQYIIDKHKALNSKNKPLPPITTAKLLPLPDDGLTVSDKEATVAKKDLTDSLSGEYPSPPVPEVPKTTGENLNKPPKEPSGTYTYTIPNSTTSKGRSGVEVETKKSPEEVYLLPDPPGTTTTTTESTTQNSVASTTYTDGTVTAILSLTTSSSPTTTAVTPSTTKLLATTSTSTVTSLSTTTSTSTVTNPSTTTTSTTGTTAGSSSSPNLTTLPTDVPLMTTPRPASISTTAPSIPVTTTSTTTTKLPSTSSAPVLQTTNSITSPKYTTEKEQITSTTPHQATKVTTNPTTGQTITSTFSTATKALETTTTSKPFVKVSFTYRENNSPAVDPYGDDTIEVVKPKPQRTWSREKPKNVKRKALEPAILVKVGNGKPLSSKSIQVERPTKPIRARPLRKEAPRNFQKKAIRPKGKLVVLGAGKKTTQQRRPQQAV